MSNMGRLVFECQTIAEEAYLDGDLEQKVKTQFADRPELIRYATETAVEIYGKLASDPPGSRYGTEYEDIPF